MQEGGLPRRTLRTLSALSLSSSLSSVFSTFCTWCCIALLVLVLAACAGGPKRGASDFERSQFDAAIRAAESDPERGAVLLADFLTANPKSALADDAAAELAQLALRAGDEAGAKEWLYLIVREYPNDETADRARLLLAGLEVQADGTSRGEGAESARALLARVRFGKLDASERRLAYRLLADLSEDPVDRLGWRVRERGAVLEELEEAEYESPVLGGGLEDLDREIAISLDQMTNEDLLRAVRTLRGEPAAVHAMLLVTRGALRAGDFGLANDYFSEIDAPLPKRCRDRSPTPRVSRVSSVSYFR